MLNNNPHNNRQYKDTDHDSAGATDIWRRRPTLNFILSLTIISVIAVCIIAIIFLIDTPRNAGITEFYMLENETGKYYPESVNPGEDISVMLGIVNRESSSQIYSIDITIAGTPVENIGPITLNRNEKWENPVTIAARAAGDNQTVEFILTRQIQLSQNDNKPLSIKFNLDVKPQEEENNEN